VKLQVGSESEVEGPFRPYGWRFSLQQNSVEVAMLHKMSKMTGFHLLASDGEIGHVDDFLVDENWTVTHLVVKNHHYFGGESVLVPGSAIETIDSPNKKIRVRLSRDEIRHSPSVDTADIELIETLPPVII
jgi:hypothetical protein